MGKISFVNTNLRSGMDFQNLNVTNCCLIPKGRESDKFEPWCYVELRLCSHIFELPLLKSSWRLGRVVPIGPGDRCLLLLHCMSHIRASSANELMTLLQNWSRLDRMVQPGVLWCGVISEPVFT